MAPLFVFLGVMTLVSLPGLKWDHPDAPWWRQQPQQWVYPLQTVVCLALVTFWWRRYTFRPLTGKGIALALAAAVVGMALWFTPNWVFRATGWENGLLGFADRSQPGFDPTLFGTGTAAWWTAVTLRFLRMVVAVPFVEELFWRGFLWQYLAAPDGRWERQPIGTPNVRAWLGSSLAMTAAHPGDLLACFIWAMLAGWLLMRTRSLGVCIAFHAASNLILGLYIMLTKQWGYW